MRAALLLALLAVPGLAHGAWMVPPPPDRAKDFSIIKRDGWYHVFYIRHDMSVPFDSTERDLGHAISQDFYNWTQLPPVLPVRPDHWDNARIWAPDIHEIDGVYYMIYTGVTDVPGEYAFHQRIGLATSTDLMTWNRLDDPVFACAQIPWSFCDSLQYTGGELRDASVMPDPQGSGWIMHYTAAPASSPGTYVAGTAYSAGDLAQWSSGPPLWITHSSWSGSAKVESPHVFAHDGLYYLVYTADGNQPLRLMTGPDPAGEATTWTDRGTIGNVVGADTRLWFASEYFREGTHEYFCFANYDRVDVREIVWGPDWTFTLTQPSMFHVQSLTWNATEIAAGQPIDLTFECVNPIGSQAAIEAFAVAPDGSREPVSLDELGLPGSIPMTGPTTVYTWTARNWPDANDPYASWQVVVRLKDQTAEAAPLQILPAPWTDPGWAGPGDNRWRSPRDLIQFSRARTGVAFRALTRSPLGSTALLVDVDQPTPARIELFDLGGRRVRALADRTLPAGATVIPWDGRDEAGALARAGVYFARLTTPGLERSIRILRTP